MALKASPTRPGCSTGPRSAGAIRLSRRLRGRPSPFRCRGEKPDPPHPIAVPARWRRGRRADSPGAARRAAVAAGDAPARRRRDARRRRPAPQKRLRNLFRFLRPARGRAAGLPPALALFLGRTTRRFGRRSAQPDDALGGDDGAFAPAGSAGSQGGAGRRRGDRRADHRAQAPAGGGAGAAYHGLTSGGELAQRISTA